MVNANRVIQELGTEFAPYAYTRNVMQVITRRRERGLPNPLTAQVLETISIPTGNVSRTLQALRFLGLIEDDGSHTELWDGLTRANEREGQYRESLEEIVRGAYHRVFEIVDPAQDGDIAIHDAFRQFQPEAQRGRMQTLFLGMCQEAGVIQPRGRERRADASRSQLRENQQRQRRPTPQLSKQQRGQAQEGIQRRLEDDDSHLLFAVIRQIPTQRQWTADRRRRWLSAVEAAVDLMVDVVDNEEAQ